MLFEMIGIPIKITESVSTVQFKSFLPYNFLDF